MKLTWTWLLAIGAICLVRPHAAPSAEKAPAAERGLMRAVIVAKGPAIDGTLKDPIWRKCPPLELGRCTSSRSWPLKTAARVLFDATTLYVAFECAETDTDDLAATVSDRDGPVWKDDSVELFVTGDVREGYFHFAVNPRGAFMDTRSVGGRRDDKSFNTTGTVKASVQKGTGWTVTMALPLKELGAYVGKGQTWIANLNRTRPKRGGKDMMEWSWAVMGSNDYHSLPDFGKIAGVSIPKRDGGVTRTAGAPPKLPSYDKGTSKGGVIVYRQLPKVDIPDTGSGTTWALPLNILRSRGLKVAFLARGTGGAGRCAFNMMDKRSNDNTTSFSYRTVTERFKPVVYSCDRFRYNSNMNVVSNNTQYNNIRFHGNNTGGKGALHLRNFVIYRGEDAAPPAAPAGLKAKAEAGGVRLTWKPAEDNAGVAGYAVSRAAADGTFKKVAHVFGPECVDLPAEAGSYKYRVLAVDFQDNVGPWSKVASVRTARAYKPPPPALLAKDRAGYADNVWKIHRAGLGKVVKGRVLMFGDSITGATMWRVEAECALGRYRVEARGYAAMRTSFGKNRIKAELNGLNPEFCLIMYGTNNSKSQAAVPPAMDDLLSIARDCAANGTVPIVATIPPRGFKDPESKPEANFNKAVIEMCRKNDIPTAYVFEAFQAGGDRKKLVAGDGVHLVDGGFCAAGRAWLAAMEQVNFVLLDRRD